MKTSLLLLPILVLLSIQTFAQDIILKKNDVMIKCKIKEVGLDEIKYLLPEYSSDVVFAIDKDNVSKIIFENGEEMVFQKEMSNPANYEDNRKNALKVEFLSPLVGSTTFSWEHSLKPGRSWEATLGIAGMGFNTYENAAGVFTKFGYKFIKSPDFYLRGLKYAHLLKGAYVKPELALGLVSQDVYRWHEVYDPYSQYWYSTTYESRETVFAGAVLVVLGKQWIFDNIFAVDLHCGLGYGFYSSGNDISTGYHSGFVTGDTDFPIALSGGFKIGMLIK